MSKEVEWIKDKPAWVDGMFDGWGGYEGETADIRVICDHEFAQILPTRDRKYLVFPHELCVFDVVEEEDD